MKYIFRDDYSKLAQLEKEGKRKEVARLIFEEADENFQRLPEEVRQKNETLRFYYSNLRYWSSIQKDDDAELQKSMFETIKMQWLSFIKMYNHVASAYEAEDA